MNWKLTVGIIIFLIAAGIIIFNNTYNKPHLDVSEADSDFEIGLAELFDEFSADEMAATKKYAEKVILTEGIFKSSSEGEFTNILMEDSKGRIANCELEAKSPVNIEPGQKIKLKGLFIGYNDLMGELQMKKCTILRE
jgi:hypothetical protein